MANSAAFEGQVGQSVNLELELDDGGTFEVHGHSDVDGICALTLTYAVAETLRSHVGKEGGLLYGEVLHHRLMILEVEPDQACSGARYVPGTGKATARILD